MKSFSIKALMLVFVLIPAVLLAADVLDDIALSLKSGNARELSKHFDSNIEITILDTEDVYSKAQAEVVVKDFFTKNKPTAFELIHQGSSKEGSKYGIGNMTTAKGVFRTYVFVKQKGSAYYIQELRFEEE